MKAKIVKVLEFIDDCLPGVLLCALILAFAFWVDYVLKHTN